MGDLQVAVTTLGVIAVVLLSILVACHFLGPYVSAWIRSTREEKVGLAGTSGHYNANGYLVHSDSDIHLDATGSFRRFDSVDRDYQIPLVTSNLSGLPWNNAQPSVIPPQPLRPAPSPQLPPSNRPAPQPPPEHDPDNLKIIPSQIKIPHQNGFANYNPNSAYEHHISNADQQEFVYQFHGAMEEMNPQQLRTNEEDTHCFNKESFLHESMRQNSLPMLNNHKSTTTMNTSNGHIISEKNFRQNSFPDHMKLKQTEANDQTSMNRSSIIPRPVANQENNKHKRTLSIIAPPVQSTKAHKQYAQKSSITIHKPILIKQMLNKIPTRSTNPFLNDIETSDNTEPAENLKQDNNIQLGSSTRNIAKANGNVFFPQEETSSNETTQCKRPLRRHQNETQYTEIHHRNTELEEYYIKNKENLMNNKEFVFSDAKYSSAVDETLDRNISTLQNDVTAEVAVVKQRKSPKKVPCRSETESSMGPKSPTFKNRKENIDNDKKVINNQSPKLENKRRVPCRLKTDSDIDFRINSGQTSEGVNMETGGKERSASRSGSERNDSPSRISLSRQNSVGGDDESGSPIEGTLKRAVSCESVCSDSSVALGDLEEPQVKGYLCIGLEYDKSGCPGEGSDLVVTILEAKDLTGPEGSPLDTYVRVYLLPDKNSNMQTRVCRNSSSPSFKEKFLFMLPPQDLKRSLWFNVYHSGVRAHTLIGEAELRLSDISKQPVTTWLCLSDTGKNICEWGELMFSLSYLPTAERLTVVVVKARNLRGPRGQEDLGAPFVKVYLLQNGKKVNKKRTSIKRGERSPIFNEAMIFSVPPHALQTIQLRLTVSEGTTTNGGTSNSKRSSVSEGGRTLSVGHVIVGSQATGKSLTHWNQMLSALRKPIAMWHPLRRLT